MNESSDLVLHEKAAEYQVEDQNKEDIKVSFLTKYMGLLYCLIFTFAMTATSTVVKSVHTPATEKLFSRCCVQFLTLLPFVTYSQYKEKFTIFQSERRTQLLLIGRGISSSAASLLLYQGIQKIAIGDCIAISFCSTIFAGVFARICLKESYTLFDVALAMISMVGVVLIAQPEFIFGSSTEPNPEQFSGVLFSLGAAVTIGSSMTIIRGCGKLEPWVGVFYYAVFGCVISGIAFYIEGNYVIPCFSELPLFFSIGLLGNTCQFLVTKALQHERPSTVAVMRSIEIILTYIVQVLLFSNIPNAYSIVGALLILTSAVGLAVRKYLKNVEKSTTDNNNLNTKNLIKAE